MCGKCWSVPRGELSETHLGLAMATVRRMDTVESLEGIDHFTHQLGKMANWSRGFTDDILSIHRRSTDPTHSVADAVSSSSTAKAALQEANWWDLQLYRLVCSSYNLTCNLLPFYSTPTYNPVSALTTPCSTACCHTCEFISIKWCSIFRNLSAAHPGIGPGPCENQREGAWNVASVAYAFRQRSLDTCSNSSRPSVADNHRRPADR